MADKVKITKRVVDGAKPMDKRYLIQDSEIPGFALKVEISGQKIYIFDYRRGSGRSAKKRRLTIGKHGSITPDQAREAAIDASIKVRNNEDPQSEKTQKSLYFEDIFEKYLDDYVAPNNKSSTHKDKKAYFENYFKQYFKNLEIDKVTKRDILSFQNSYRSTPYLANRMLACLSHFFNFCEDWDYIDKGDNPCRRVKRFKETARERYLSEKEVKRLLDTLNKIDEDEYVIALFKLIIFTGARLGEILTAKWEYFDKKKKYLDLPDSKTGAKKIYLNDVAIQIIADIKKVPKNPYIIISKKTKNTHLSRPKTQWARICKEAKIKDCTIHDLRHAFASFGVMAGLSLEEIGQLLGHKSTQTTKRYAHLIDTHRNEIAEKISSKIDAICNPKGENIVKFEAKK